MKTIIVHYDNGDRITTGINATVEEIVRLYLDKSIIYENYETGEETMAYARSIEFIDVLPAMKAWGGVYCLRRIYSVSRRFQERYNLINKIRFTAHDYSKFIPEKIDAAYVPGLFD